MRGRALSAQFGQTDIFAGLNPLQRHAAMSVLMRGPMAHWRAGQTGPVQTGSAGLLLVKAGDCEVLVTTEDQRALILAEAGDGEVLTAAPAGLGEDEVVLRAVTDVVLCPIDHAHLRDLAGYPSVLAGLLEQCTRRAEEAQGAALRLAHRRVEDRVLLALRSFAARHGRVTANGVRIGHILHSDLAQRANVTRPGATQALARLEQDGRIVREPGGEILLVTDPITGDATGSAPRPEATRVPPALARVLRS